MWDPSVIIKNVTVEFGPPNFSAVCCNLADGFLYVTQLNPQSDVNEIAVLHI